MRNFKVEGIIIKRRNFRDSDRILTVLTKTHGKIYVKASGVRKINSRRSGHIELLNHSMLSLYKGNGFPILTEATTINNFTSLKSNLTDIGLVLHLCELIDGLCPENQENNQVYSLFLRTINELMIAESKKAIIKEFEMQLLKILGYWNESNHLQAFDTQNFIENILERKLKAHRVFEKLQQ